MGCNFSFSEPQPHTSHQAAPMTRTAAFEQLSPQQQRACKALAATRAADSVTSAAECLPASSSFSTVHSPAPSALAEPSTAPASQSTSRSTTPQLSSSARVQSLLCPIHPVHQPRPLSCEHCMLTSTALSSYPSSYSSASAALPYITAAQITQHWSSRFVEQQQQPSVAALSASQLPATSASYFSYLHSATAASSSHSHSRASQSHHYSPTYLPSIQQAPLTVRRKQHFSVDEELSKSSGSASSSTDLAVLTQQLSAVRQQRQQRVHRLHRDDSDSTLEQSTSDSDNSVAAAGKRTDRRRRVSVTRVSEQHESRMSAAEEAEECCAEADDELTSPSVERLDESELSVCRKTRQLQQLATRDAKTDDDDMGFHAVHPGVQFVDVDHTTDAW